MTICTFCGTDVPLPFALKHGGLCARCESLRGQTEEVGTFVDGEWKVSRTIIYPEG